MFGLARKKTSYTAKKLKLDRPIPPSRYTKGFAHLENPTDKTEKQKKKA